MDHAVRTVDRQGEVLGGQLAAAITYYGFLSIFPLLLLASSALGVVLQGDDRLRLEILDSALSQFPVIGDQLQTRRLDASGIGLVIGLVGLVWAGLGAMQAAEKAMNAVWDVPRKERPNYLQTRIRAVTMLAVLGVGALLLLLSLPVSARKIPRLAWARSARSATRGTSATRVAC